MAQQLRDMGTYVFKSAPGDKVVQSTSDGDLIEQARTGNQEAFELLVERYHTLLDHYISRYFVDYDRRCDVLQQVLIKLYLSLPDLHTRRSLQPWLFRVARNCCLDELRRRHVPNFSEMEWDGSEDDAFLASGALVLAQSVEEVVEQRELQQLLRRVISDLPQKYRPIVWLRYTTLLNFGEIGRILQIPEATAKTYFQRAKLQLRQSLCQLRD